MQMESIQMDTDTAFPADTMDAETKRDITMKLTLASLAAQQGKRTDASYWTKRAQDALVEFRQSQTAA